MTEQHPLDRAIQRCDAIIRIGADANEPEETQLSDVLADLMHWADHYHVDFGDAVRSAARARDMELAEWEVVLVSIENTYEDGHESETEVWLPIWEGAAPDDDWWDDVVQPHTGDGHGAEHPKLGVSYEATIMRVADPNDTTMCGVTYSWGG